MIWGTFALIFAAAFTGASFYVNWVEQPARLKLEDEALLSEWGPSDSRGVALLLAFALIAAIAGFISYFEIPGPALGVRRPRHHPELALRVFCHVAARQPDPRLARIGCRRGAGARSPVGPCRNRPHRTGLVAVALFVWVI